VSNTASDARSSLPVAFGYSMTSSTRSLSATPTIAALTTTGEGTRPAMSRSIAAPSIR
jgi:hypothetical protein